MFDINDEGVEFIRGYEKLRLRAYKDQAGIWTIGWGHTKNVHEGMVCTPEQAERWFVDEVNEAAAAVRGACRVPPSEYELSAMTSLCYNTGPGPKVWKPGMKKGFRQSEVLKAHNRGDKQAAARAFNNWSHVTIDGKAQQSKGLLRRRTGEAAMYLTAVRQDEIDTPSPVPREESSLKASPIAVGGTVAGASSALGLVSEGAQSVGLIRDSLGDWLPYILLIVGVVAAVVVVYYRIKQRKEGWA